MEFEVMLEPPDYRAFVGFCQRYASSGKPKPLNKVRVWVNGLLIGGLVGIVVAVVVTLVGLDLRSILIGAVITMLGGYLWSKRMQRRMMPGEGSCLAGPRRFVLSDDWLQADAPHGTSYTRWSAIIGVFETPDHVFVLMDPTFGYILPRRCFPDESTLASFVEYVRQRMPKIADAKG